MKREILAGAIFTILTLMTVSCSLLRNNRRATEENGAIITTRGTSFVKGNTPYNYIGTNLWYASILASKGEGGNRERFCRELDFLRSIGVTNLRIAAGPDAGSDLANPAKPYLQEAPGVLNDTILEGLDFALAELEKRGMYAVIYLNNAWDWSGGFGFYLKECGYGDSPNTNVDGGYNRYVDYCANFAREPRALDMYYNYLRQIVSRRNRQALQGRAGYNVVAAMQRAAPVCTRQQGTIRCLDIKCSGHNKEHRPQPPCIYRQRGIYWL